MLKLSEKAIRTIIGNKLIKKGDKIVVGVSGGPDSVCLLNILYRLKNKFNLKLVVAHVNYGMRAKNADKDEQLVKKLASNMGLKFKTLHHASFKESIAASNVEEQFRNIRYDFFHKILREEKADSIAVAHTRNDQAETILMFFLRGAGLRGLSGMKYKQNNVIRPLLDICRSDILAYLKQNKLNFRMDITNEDISYTRNKIRHKLIPYLNKEFNPNLISTLVKNAEVIRDDYEFIDQATRVIYQVLAESKKSKIKLDLKKFLGLYSGLQRSIIRLLLEKFLGDVRGISVLDIEETLRMLKEAKEGSYRDIKGLRVLKRDGKIVVSKKN